MKNRIKIAFSDMWGFEGYQFNPLDNYFTDLFSLSFDVEIDPHDPDLLIYSVFGSNYKNFDCKKILFSGENLDAGKGEIPHYDDADVTLSHYEDLPKEIFMPLWVIFINWFNKDQPRPLPSNPTYAASFDLIQNNRERFLKDRKFCAFINNAQIEDRIKLFQELHQNEHVDSFGNLFNNVGKPLRGSQEDKIKLLQDYKFNIAFENSYHKGYSTEKITEPLEAGCIPLYNGGERVKNYFNPSSFLYYKDFESMEAYVTQILNIHTNQDLYEEMVLSPPLNLENIYRDLKPDVVLHSLLKKLNL
jgi:hypothetical protein